MPTAAIILAAGASTRLGQPKQLIRLGTETLLERAVRVALDAGCFPVVVVLGAEASRIRDGSNLREASVAVNDAWPEGMAASIKAGLEAVRTALTKVGAGREIQGAVLLVCDQPAVTAAHLRDLISHPDEIAASEYAGRRGAPAYFPVSSFAALGQLTGDYGARELLRDARAIPLPHGELDIDTPEALAEARTRFAPK